MKSKTCTLYVECMKRDSAVRIAPSIVVPYIDHVIADDIWHYVMHCRTVVPYQRGIS